MPFFKSISVHHGVVSEAAPNKLPYFVGFPVGYRATRSSGSNPESGNGGTPPTLALLNCRVLIMCAGSALLWDADYTVIRFALWGNLDD